MNNEQEKKTRNVNDKSSKKKNFILKNSSNNLFKNYCKALVNSQVLQSLNLKTGDFVRIENERNCKKHVLAIIESNPKLYHNDIIEISKCFRKTLNFLQGERVQIIKYHGQPSYAKNVKVLVKFESDIADSNLANYEQTINNTLQDIGVIFSTLEFTLDIKNQCSNFTTKVNVKVLDIFNENNLDDKIKTMKISEVDTEVINDNKFYLFLKNKSKIILTNHSNTVPFFALSNEIYSFNDIGGLTKQIDSLKFLIKMSLNYTQFFFNFKVPPSRGILLHGSPGTGKSMLLNCIMHFFDVHILNVKGSEIISKFLGDSEKKLISIFNEAIKFQPSIIIMDEIDFLTSVDKSNDNSGSDIKLVNTLISLMDQLNGFDKVVVIGSTNKIHLIDLSLRRSGRFDQEIEITVPNADERYQILHKQLSKVDKSLIKINNDELKSISIKTHGYVGSDLITLYRESVTIALKESIQLDESYSKICLDHKHMVEALSKVTPSAMKEIFLDTPKVYWSEIAGQLELKKKLTEVVQLPLLASKTFQNLGIRAPKGVLLYGPPGCSKTMTAKALATESGLNFIAVKGPEIFNKFVGESERTIREIFRKAKLASPSIIFFDEIDALSRDRDSSNSAVSNHVLMTLLNEMDGIEELKEVVIIAATNRPTEIDPALLRPGRLDRHIYVGPPDFEARLQILKRFFFMYKLDDDDFLNYLTEETDGCSGAEIVLLCQEAGLNAIFENLNTNNVQKKNFEAVLKDLSKAVNKEMLEYYKKFLEKHKKKN